MPSVARLAAIHVHVHHACQMIWLIFGCILTSVLHTLLFPPFMLISIPTYFFLPRTLLIPPHVLISITFYANLGLMRPVNLVPELGRLSQIWPFMLPMLCILR